MQVAHTILEQLGGSRFVAMTGAKSLVAGDDFLQFKIGAGAVNKANTVRITLERSDLYRVQFYRVRGLDVREIGEPLTGVYGDQLQGAFTASTGMDTYL
jgi:hypothetical protein